MNEKGFTLIELLAVIVILAIIALIATPIVLSIINDSKKSSNLRSAEMYLSAVEYGIADTIMNNKTIPSGTHNVLENGNICIGTYSNKICTGDIIEVEVNGDTPEEGSTITITDGKIEGISLLYGDKIIIKDISGNIVYEKTLDDICTYDKSSTVAEKTAGAKYSCEVKPGTNYNFYVLTTPEEGYTTINLIMDRNIYYDSINDVSGLTNSTNDGKIGWISNSDYTIAGGINWSLFEQTDQNTYGPITAMNYLYNATKDWLNIPNIVINYEDEGNNYGSIITTDNITKITKIDGTAVTVLKNQEGYTDLKARMPFSSEVSTSNGNNNYLYEYLDSTQWSGVGDKPSNNIDEIAGYWLFVTSVGDVTGAKYVDGYGRISYNLVTGDIMHGDKAMGVRPVITLKL